MAKSPQKPTKVKATSKNVDKAHEAIYSANQEVIDKVLRLCTGHLKKFEGKDVALEAIRRLKDYYLKHGTSGPGTFGRKARGLM